EDVRRRALLSASIPVWGRLVGALVATKGTSCGIRPAAASAALKLMANPAAPLPVDLVLSAYWLCQIAGEIPEELRKRSPFQAILSNASGDRPAGPARLDSSFQEGGPRSGLLMAIGNLLKGHDAEAEQRRAALSAEVQRLSAELERKEKDLETARTEIS